MTAPKGVRAALDLLAWRRRVFDLYAEVRATPNPEEGWHRWRSVRDVLFREHPQSPIPEARRDAFREVPYFDYDLACRVEARVEPVGEERLQLPGSAGETFKATRFGRAHFALRGSDHRLDVFWLEGYAGGVFLSFADATSGEETYGAGRYLLDTVKGSDLGEREGLLLLDFNFAYNPSCAYDPRWACPLAPPQNRLPIRVEAGELLP